MQNVANLTQNQQIRNYNIALNVVEFCALLLLWYSQPIEITQHLSQSCSFSENTTISIANNRSSVKKENTNFSCVDKVSGYDWKLNDNYHFIIPLFVVFAAKLLRFYVNRSRDNQNLNNADNQQIDESQNLLNNNNDLQQANSLINQNNLNGENNVNNQLGVIFENQQQNDNNNSSIKLTTPQQQSLMEI